MADLEDDSTRDLTVWDLAKRNVTGFPVSSQGLVEIEAKWHEMQELLRRLRNGAGAGPIDHAKELVDMREALIKALALED